MGCQSPQEPSIVFLVEVDELIHTDDQPFCPDGARRCHEDQTLLGQVADAARHGLLLPDEAVRLIAGQMI
jgi:hypothetical protein